MSIESIKARVEKATEGPWEDDGLGVVFSEDLIVAATESDGYINDGIFIAHSRQDIPLLLAVAEAAKKYRENRYANGVWPALVEALVALEAAE